MSKNLILPFLLLSLIFISSAIEVDPTAFPKILDFAKNAANEKVQGEFR